MTPQAVSTSVPFMDGISILIIVAILLLPLILFLRLGPYPTIPAVPWREYLPHGQMYKFLSDPGQSVTCLMELTKIHGDIFQCWVGPSRTLVTGHPEDIAQTLALTREFDRPPAVRFSLNTVVPGSFFTVPLDVHKRLRRNIRDTFNHTLLQSFHADLVNAIHEVSHILCTKQAEAGATPDPPAADNKKRFSSAFDISKVLSTLTFRIIVNVAFGADWDIQHREYVNEVTNQLLDALTEEVLGYPFRAILQSVGYRNRLLCHYEKLRLICEQLVETRRNESEEERKARSPDVLDTLLEPEDENVVCSISQVIVFLLAGGHTSNHTICWLLYEALQKPHIVENINAELAQLQRAKQSHGPLAYEDVAELHYVRKVWRETLRLHPPGGCIFREALKDVTLKGSNTDVQKGSLIALMPQRAHTHEAHWSNPLEFNPERWGTSSNPGEGDRVPAGAYVPFSAGAKNCAGQAFADYEGVLVVAELFRTFEFELACEPEEVISMVSWVAVGRYSSKKDGNLDMGIPLRVRLR